MNVQAPPPTAVKSSSARPTVGAKNAAATKAAVATFSAVKRDFFLDLSVFHLKFPMLLQVDVEKNRII